MALLCTRRAHARYGLLRMTCTSQTNTRTPKLYVHLNSEHGQCQTNNLCTVCVYTIKFFDFFALQYVRRDDIDYPDLSAISFGNCWLRYGIGYVRSFVYSVVHSWLWILFLNNLENCHFDVSLNGYSMESYHKNVCHESTPKNVQNFLWLQRNSDHNSIHVWAVQMQHAYERKKIDAIVKRRSIHLEWYL